jgi:hypothetical protein
MRKNLAAVRFGRTEEGEEVARVQTGAGFEMTRNDHRELLASLRHVKGLVIPPGQLFSFVPAASGSEGLPAVWEPHPVRRLAVTPAGFPHLVAAHSALVPWQHKPSLAATHDVGEKKIQCRISYVGFFPCTSNRGG